MGLESKLTHDFDDVIAKFENHFSASQNVKFSFKYTNNDIMQLYLNLSELVEILKQNNWVCKFWKCESAAGEAGYVYGRKDNKEYAIAGFLHLTDKDEIILDGVLYGRDKEDLAKTYMQMLNIFKQHFEGVEELEPVEKYIWQEAKK